MATVTLEHIFKRFADVTAVEDINLEIEDGEFVTLVGPSGSGKSTTLDMIAGLTTPSEGTVWIGDRDVTNLPPKDRDIAMVFQNIALFPHMDVYDNISFGLRLRDYDKAEIDDRVQNAATILQIEELLERMPDELSGGQRQRVAIGRAIVRNPSVFLMDEPLANLDAKLRIHMRTELQRLHQQLETTIIYVTHDQAEAMTMSDRIAILNTGQLQQIAPPLTCYNEPANTFVAGFIGSPSMNLIDGELTDTGVETLFFSLDLDSAEIDGATRGDRVTVGIRPEDVYRDTSETTLPTASQPIHTTVDVTEPMGDEIFAYLQFEGAGETAMEGEDGAEQLLMSVDPDSDIDIDEALDVVLDRSKVHLFDGATGQALAHGIVDMTDDEQVTEPSDANT